MNHTGVIRIGFHCLCYHSSDYACFGLACLGNGLGHYLFQAFYLHDLVDFIHLRSHTHARYYFDICSSSHVKTLS